MKKHLHILFSLIIIVFINQIGHAQSYQNTDDIIANKETNVPETQTLQATLKAVYVSDKVYVNWVTSENNQENYYMIERSDDGITFNVIGLKNGVKSTISQGLLFSFIDNNPLNNYSYYRIIQIVNHSIEKMTAAVEVFTKPTIEPVIFQPAFADAFR